MNVQHSPEKQALVEAAKLCGGQKRLAERLTAALGKRVSQQWVWSIINREQPVPADWCLPIERITIGIVEAEQRGSIVTKERLRPDVFLGASQ